VRQAHAHDVVRRMMRDPRRRQPALVGQPESEQNLAVASDHTMRLRYCALMTVLGLRIGGALLATTAGSRDAALAAIDVLCASCQRISDVARRNSAPRRSTQRSGLRALGRLQAEPKFGPATD